MSATESNRSISDAASAPAAATDAGGVRLAGEVDAAAARALVHRAAEVDGVEALSEQFLLGLSDAGLSHRHLAALGADGRLLGLAVADGETAELVVDPQARRRGVARALVGELGAVPLWAHGDLPAARGLAGKLGYGPVRELLVLEVVGDALRAGAGAAGALGGASASDGWGTGVDREGFVAADLEESAARLGREAVLDAWLEVNNDAFSWHPEQGGWDRRRLERAMQAEWFDPADVLLLWDTSRPQTPRLAGFHWTKWHGEVDGVATGEVYVIGLASAWRGRRLGDPLLELGLVHLADKGAGRVLLYVEADNEAAVKAYRRRGFTDAERHVVYAPGD